MEEKNNFDKQPKGLNFFDSINPWYSLFMERFFNKTGPCNPQDHYMVPPKERLRGARLDKYIKHKLYWVLHGPRQTGKTTFLLTWMEEINQSGQALACYVTLERCQGITEPDQAMPAICRAIIAAARDFLGEPFIPQFPQVEPLSMVDTILRDWASRVAPKPLVVLFDEADVLQDQAMVSFLRQLRGGFVHRGVGVFPVSVALVGMRDLKDYIIRNDQGIEVNPASPFNIKQDSAIIANFSIQDITSLASMHSSETGQIITDQAIQLIFDLTQGQPWLTNAILQSCIWNHCSQGEPVEPHHVLLAKEDLIQERATHLDSLAERLKDPRIKPIVEAIILGTPDPTLTEGNGFLLAMDLGLVTKQGGTVQIANPIYREVIARVLSQSLQDAIPEPDFPWTRADGSLDMDRLLQEFQNFWREHSEIWETRVEYTEAFPHLLLMAFLQRVVNGGGRIEREYAAGRGRIDLAVEYGGKWTIIEIKLVSTKGRDKTIDQGLNQAEAYRSILDPRAPAYLVVFDRTVQGRAKPWEERLYWEVRPSSEGVVTVVGG